MLAIRDPIHRQIPINEQDRRLIRTKLFQRLQDVKHLALAYKKFPSATHSRFSHSLGVMHLCSLVFDRLAKNTSIDISKFRNKIRVAGALHDIGQGPFSHLAERITGFSHEKATILFVEHDEEIRKVLKENFEFDDVDIEQITSLICGNKDKFNDLVGSSDYEFLTEILNGPLDVDKLDYLQRDSYHTGVGFGTTEFLMLLDNLVPKDGSIVIEDGGIYAAEMLMVSRLEMYQAVYMNESIRARETAVVEAFHIIKKHDLVSDLNKYNYYKIDLPPNVPIEFAFSDIALKMLISDAKELSNSPNNTELSDDEKTLINYCYNVLWDQAVPKEEEFSMVFENKIDNIKDAVLRKRLYKLKDHDKRFEDAVKRELEGTNVPIELILVDTTKFLPYGLKKEKLGDEPIIKLNDTETRNLSKVSYISRSLKEIPAEPLRIFIPNKYLNENHEKIKKVIQEKFGEFNKSEDASL